MGDQHTEPPDLIGHVRNEHPVTISRATLAALRDAARCLTEVGRGEFVYAKERYYSQDGGENARVEAERALAWLDGVDEMLRPGAAQVVSELKAWGKASGVRQHRSGLEDACDMEQRDRASERRMREDPDPNWEGKA